MQRVTLQLSCPLFPCANILCMLELADVPCVSVFQFPCIGTKFLQTPKAVGVKNPFATLGKRIEGFFCSIWTRSVEAAGMTIRLEFVCHDVRQ